MRSRPSFISSDHMPQRLPSFRQAHDVWERNGPPCFQALPSSALIPTMRSLWLLAAALPLACASSGEVPAQNPSSAPVAAPYTEPATAAGKPPTEPAHTAAPMSLDSLPASGLDTPETTDNAGLAVCNGSLTKAAVDLLAEQARQTKACYDQLLRNDAEAHGRMFVDATYELSGDIRSFALDGPITDSEFHACVAAAFKEGLVAAPPTISCVAVRVPLMFVKKEKDEEEAPPVAE